MRWSPTGRLLAIVATLVVARVAHPAGYVRRDPTRSTAIVFVHGALGDGTSTWTNQTTRAYFPALLTQDSAFDDANVYVLELPAPKPGKIATPAELAAQMHDKLSQDGILEHPSLVIVSHSLGGIVTRAWILRNRSVANSIRLLYFLGTPTSGRPNGNIAALLNRNPKFRNMFPIRADANLATLQRDWRNARLGVRSLCAYETADTIGILMVDRQSASALCTEPPEGIPDNHVDIAKPADTNAPAYAALRTVYQRAGAPVATIARIDHPIVHPERPIDTQVRLFAEDRVRLSGGDGIRLIWLGDSWEPYLPNHTYRVTGPPGEPVTPRFDPTPESPVTLEVKYTKYLDRPRSISTPPPAPDLD